MPVNNENTSTTDERHQQRMQRKKAVVDAGIARATEERGIIIVHTGNGKGKSSAAFGMVARALGHDMRVAIIQFGKGKNATGEEIFFRKILGADYHVMGEGFTWETQDRDRDIRAAEAAWQKACEYIADPGYDLVVLDELNITLKHKYLELDKVLATLQQRPHMQHVIITGRAAQPELIEIADTVTNMQNTKHAYKAGVRAQKGIEL